MKKQIVMIAAIGMCMGASSAAWSYDKAMAESYAKLLAPAKGAKTEKELRFVKPDAFIKDLQEGKKFVTLDVRNPEETGIYTMSLPGSLSISIDQLFLPENLDKIPADKPVMVLCKSGGRATIAATGLRQIGFSDVYILKGGYEALSTYFGVKEAFPDPAEAKGK